MSTIIAKNSSTILTGRSEGFSQTRLQRLYDLKKGQLSRLPAGDGSIKRLVLQAELEAILNMLAGLARL